MIEELRNLPAPAKLNLFLHVTGRRADGYHLLETVFDLIDLGDRLHLRIRNDGALIRRDSLPGVSPEQDLTIRAARLLAEETGCRLGVDIRIDKRIPMGGGLGGGSSDAATMLLGLNRLWNLGLSRRQLMRLALRLGADVPFFVFGRCAYATGIGEKLTALPLPASWYLVVAPPVPISTASVFASPGLTRNTEALKIDGLSRERCVRLGRNDLEPVVATANPAVETALNLLRQVAVSVGVAESAARMSGSGSCVFLPVEDEQTAVEAETLLLRAQAGGGKGGGGRTLGGRKQTSDVSTSSDGGFTVFRCRSLESHPLSDWAFAAAS
jgi:4-diphosphocytidyl-2-C-methyl-D-erythritol kinase